MPRCSAIASMTSGSRSKPSRAREHRGAQHPHRILDEADARIADRSDDALLEILEPAHVVDDRLRARCRRRAPLIVKSRRNASSSGVPNVLSRWMIRARRMGVTLAPDRRPVVGRLPAGGTSRSRRWSGGAADAHHDRVRLARPSTRCLRHDLPERRDLDRLGAELDVRQPEPAADDPAVPEQLLDLVRDARPCRCRSPSAGGRAAGRGRCRRRDRRRDCAAAGDRGRAARQDRCPGERSGVSRAGRSTGPGTDRDYRPPPAILRSCVFFSPSASVNLNDAWSSCSRNAGSLASPGAMSTSAAIR